MDSVIEIILCGDPWKDKLKEKMLKDQQQQKDNYINVLSAHPALWLSIGYLQIF